MAIARLCGSKDRNKWLVLAASLFVSTFAFGFCFMFGTLFNDILDKFGESRPKTASIHAILIGTTLSTGVLSGMLVSLLGIRKVSILGAILCPLGMVLAFFAESIVHLNICIGVITGVGTSMLFVSSTAAVGVSFTGSERLLALAIHNSGTSIAGIVIPYVLNFCSEKYGLNGTFLLFGGFFLNCLPVGMILGTAERYVRVNGPFIKHDSLSSGWKWLEPIKQELQLLKENIAHIMSIPYVLTALAVGIVYASVNGYMAVVLDILRWKGLSRSEALLAYPLAYGIGFVARLVPGVLKQIKGFNSLTLPIVYSICGCTGQCLIYLLTPVPGVLVGCALTGIASSGVIAAVTIVVVQIVGDEHIAIGIGLINTVIGVLSAASGPAYGYIRDSSESYGIVLMVTTGLLLVGTCLFAMTVVARKQARRRQHACTRDV